jgi:ABC-type transport system involved in cytochrome c biogenesis permease subunit
MQFQPLIIISLIAFICWISGILLLAFTKMNVAKNIGLITIILGTAALAAYIVYLWIFLQRPPIKTLGETRLWYALFLSLIGIITYFRWRWIAILGYSLVMSAVFLVVDLAKHETYDQTLMPALQSTWFIPHVVVYMVAYAFLAFATLIAIWGLLKLYRNNPVDDIVKKADNIVHIGFAFLTFGLLFGALWAKEAWGNYWTWDPKETWAFITWMCYLIYIHVRFHYAKKIKLPLIIITLSFFIIMICWFGINYLPSAANSVHVYGR